VKTTDESKISLLINEKSPDGVRHRYKSEAILASNTINGWIGNGAGGLVSGSHQNLCFVTLFRDRACYQEHGP
jgi:hypothetical protein